MSNANAGSEEKAGAEGAPQKEITAKSVMEAVRRVPLFGDHERDEATRWLAEGHDKFEAHMVLATHYHMRGVEAGTPDYYSIRDNDADDGTYMLRDHMIIDEPTMQEAGPRCIAQLPLAAQAVHHAVQAIALAPEESAALFTLERAMEGLIDAGGTILAIAASQVESASGVACQGEGQTPPTSEVDR
jgi:hypothetical protein